MIVLGRAKLNCEVASKSQRVLTNGRNPTSNGELAQPTLTMPKGKYTASSAQKMKSVQGCLERGDRQCDCGQKATRYHRNDFKCERCLRIEQQLYGSGERLECSALFQNGFYERMSDLKGMAKYYDATTRVFSLGLTQIK